jgi:hypothetical protein
MHASVWTKEEIERIRQTHAVLNLLVARILAARPSHRPHESPVTAVPLPLGGQLPQESDA